MAQEAVGSGESSSDADAALPRRAEDYIQTASQCYGASMPCDFSGLWRVEIR